MTLRASAGADGVIDIAALRLDSDTARAAYVGRVGQNTLTGTVDAALPDLSVFSGLAGQGVHLPAHGDALYLGAETAHPPRAPEQQVVTLLEQCPGGGDAVVVVGCGGIGHQPGQPALRRRVGQWR